MPGKLTTFEIMLDNQGGVVKAGDTVKGQVLVENSVDLNVLEIRIIFTGQAHVQWAGSAEYSVSSLADVQTSVVTDEKADEVYFNHIVPLFPTPSEARRLPHTKMDEYKLEKGSHSFDFSFQVPPECPHSFDGTYGHVRYFLKGVVERAWHVAFNMRTITVESNLDLNTVPGAWDPVSLTDSMYIYNMFSRVGDCHATMRLPKKGALAGQVLPAEFSVHNRSDRDIYSVSMHFKMTVVFYSLSKKATRNVELRKVSLGKVPAWRTLEGRERGISIPANCPPTGLPGCSIITVQYKLELRVKPSRMSPKRLKLVTDIIVGTEPPRDSPPDYWSVCLPRYEDVMDANCPWLLTPSTSTTNTITTTTSTTDTTTISTSNSSHTPSTTTVPTSTAVTTTSTNGPPLPPPTTPPPPPPLPPPPAAPPPPPSSSSSSLSSNRTNGVPMLPRCLQAPPAYNDEPRLTVLRRPRTPSPQGEQPPRMTPNNNNSSQRRTPLIRPRANSTETSVRLLAYRRLSGR